MIPRRLSQLLVIALPFVLLACAVAGGVAAPPTSAPVPPTEPPSPAPPSVEPPTLAPAEATSIVPLPPTHVVSPQVTPVDGWLTYHNDYVGYAFDYPSDAEINEMGVSGYPTEMLPPGMDPGEYTALLEAALPDNLCVGVGLPAAFFVVAPSPAAGGDFTGPCGVTGVGEYDLKNHSEMVSVAGAQVESSITEVLDRSTGEKLNEFASIRLDDGTRLQYGSAWSQRGRTYDDYLLDRAVILRILASFRWEK
jgi:hypothetical protein